MIMSTWGVQIVGDFLDVGGASRLRLGHPMRLVRRNQVDPELWGANPGPSRPPVGWAAAG